MSVREAREFAGNIGQLVGEGPAMHKKL